MKYFKFIPLIFFSMFYLKAYSISEEDKQRFCFLKIKKEALYLIVCGREEILNKKSLNQEIQLRNKENNNKSETWYKFDSSVLTEESLNELSEKLRSINLSSQEIQSRNEELINSTEDIINKRNVEYTKIGKERDLENYDERFKKGASFLDTFEKSTRKEKSDFSFRLGYPIELDFPESQAQPESCIKEFYINSTYFR